MYSKALIVVLGLVLVCLTSSSLAQRSNITCTINHCNWQTAKDLRGQATIEIDFGDYFYSPACVRISVNATVMFNGSFTMHPLVPGTVSPSYSFSEDNTSFIGTLHSGDSAAFETSMDNELGVYPYVCIAHYTDDMYGAIWVEDESSEEQWSTICGAPIIPAPETPISTTEPDSDDDVPATQIGSTASLMGFSAGLLLISAVLL
jgi:plastocyanin